MSTGPNVESPGKQVSMLECMIRMTYEHVYKGLLLYVYWGEDLSIVELPFPGQGILNSVEETSG